MKESHSQELASAEVREGTTYQSECILLPSSCTDGQEDEKIPAAPNASFPPLKPSDLAYAQVFFDVETSTTGLGPDSDIIQLAALANGKTFSCYALPDKAISKEAQNVTGLTLGVVGGKRVLLKGKSQVCTTTLASACSDFLAWLEGVTNSSLVLVAHTLPEV